MMNRFDYLLAFQMADEAFQELRAEARRDFVAMFPIQARIQDRVSHHILEGAFREAAMLKHWKHSQSYIEIPSNLTPDLRLRKDFP